MTAVVETVAGAIASLCLPKVWQCFCEYDNGVQGLRDSKSILEHKMEVLRNEPSSSSASQACQLPQEWCRRAESLIEECPWWNLRKRYRLSVDIPIHQGNFDSVKDHLNSEIQDLRDKRKTPTQSHPDSQQTFESEIWYQEQAVPESVFGMEETVKNVVEELVSDSGNRWVGVWGMGGLGKTTLAKLVNNNQTIQKHFDRKVMWITLGKDSSREQLKQKLQSKKVKLRVSSDSELDTCLKEALVGLKRVLFILDDVWDEGMLEIFDRAVKQPSKVLVTTRTKDVLDSTHAKVFQPHKLTEEESINLFRLKAFGSREPKKNLLGIADQMAKGCGGLPLVVEVTGGCMSAYQDGEVEEWERLSNIFHEHAAKLHDKVEDKVLRVLKLSYDELSHIKQPVNGLKLQECFLYMAAFPEDSRIKLYDLAKCWIGEELVAEEHDVKEIVNCLKRRCLVQVYEEYGRKAGLHEHLTFLRVHDMVRQLCIEICKGTFGWKKHESGCLFGHSLQENVSQESKYRKVALHSGGVEAEVTDVILLDGNRSFEPSFLEKLGNSKVLSLRKTRIKVLPDNIWKMTGLTVLDLQDTTIEEIPDHIYGMRKLRYLRVGGDSEPVLNNFRFQNLSMLHDLRLTFRTTLKTVDLNGLSSLHHLKVLRLSCSSHDDESVMETSDDDESVMETSDDDESVTLKFPEGLSMLKHLQELRVVGRMDFGSIKLKNLRICDLEGEFLNGDWKTLVMSSTQVKILRVELEEDLFKDSRRRSSSGDFRSWLKNSSQSITVLDLRDGDDRHDFFSLPELPQLVALQLSIESGGAPTTQLSFPSLKRLRLVCDDAPHDDLFHAADMKNLSVLKFESTPGRGVWRHLPSSIASLANLKKLGICDVGMERLFTQTAAGSFSVDKLSIDMSLEYPDEFFEPGGFDIKELSLNVGKNVEHLPQSITMLRSLRELTIYGTWDGNGTLIRDGGNDTLKTMFGDDEGFSSLTELRELHIWNMRGLTRLPHTTALLPHLEVVYISNCPSLKQLCAEEAPDVNDGAILFPSLEYLTLDHGINIPDWLQNRPGLEIRQERDDDSTDTSSDA